MFFTQNVVYTFELPQSLTLAWIIAWISARFDAAADNGMLTGIKDSKIRMKVLCTCVNCTKYKCCVHKNNGNCRYKLMIFELRYVHWLI